MPRIGRCRSARTIISTRSTAALVFERELARGFRLDIPAGTAVRFEPGQRRSVDLVEYAGVAARVRLPGQDHGGAVADGCENLPPAYAEMFGPTTGDRVRLADTALLVEVEQDSRCTARK